MVHSPLKIEEYLAASILRVYECLFVCANDHVFVFFTVPPFSISHYNFINLGPDMSLVIYNGDILPTAETIQLLVRKAPI